ncbi:hypothetical protein [Clostridium sp.]|uniref:hypothetical protein n=1 Tax=Clostridium sp. TaxID=1506 RepID=UPI001A4A946E|nr:hypothetical protein [Clostridium sp.]MBK5241917.1 hypothetical protein [Clostridium sp.]
METLQGKVKVSYVEKGMSVNSNKKIITTYKFNKHMEVHKNSFIVPYQKLLDELINNGQFDKLQKSFEELVIEFPYNIGISQMVEINENDKVFYAKRMGRNIFTKFVKNREPKIVNKCIVCLKQSYTNINEYFLITMFPGEQIIKEPEDNNIKEKKTLEHTLEFWGEHAIIFDEETVDSLSYAEECPYTHLWQKEFK